MTFDINLEWLAFNVDLNTVSTWMKANAGPNYCGVSGNSQCQINFTADPGDTVASDIAAYWAALTNLSPEATNYVSKEDRAAAAETARASKLASATTKLEALGLTSDEISAILGQ